MSLLKKALEVKVEQDRKNNISADEMELGVAWLQGKVHPKQLRAVIKGDVYSRMAIYVREAYRKGKLTLAK